MYANQLTPASRAMLGAKYRINAAYAGQLSSGYAHARGADPQGTLLVREADALAEVEHVCGLYQRQRKLLTVTVRWGDYQPGQIVRITYPRYGLDSGMQAFLVAVTKDYIDRTVKLTCWI